MATKTASATLASAFNITPITGFIAYQQGQLDSVSGTIKAIGSSRWGDVKSWSSFTDYRTTFQAIKWTSNLLDLGEVRYFTLNVNTEFDGTLYFVIHTSSTGAFRGEETETKVQDGDYNVAAFYGRYVYVTAFCTGLELKKMQIKADNTTTEINLRDVVTSTLSGSNTARQIPLAQPVSRIVDIDIKVKSVTAYAVDLYVSSSATSVVTIPVVVSKSSTPTFALYGIDNQPRDGTVDITLRTLPRQVMTSGNLITIT
jgi:hypothetical protein